MPEQTHTNIRIEEKENAEIEITGEIPASVLDELRPKAIENLGKNVELDGFRKGHVPADVLASKLGDGAILSEAAELALSQAYPKIIAEQKLDVVGRPQVTITKLAPGNPLGFTIRTPVLKPLELPDYKGIAAEALGHREPIEVTDADVEQVIDRILEHHQQVQEAQQSKEQDGAAAGGILGPDGKPLTKNKTEANKPELTDELVKTLGDFKNIEDFKTKLRESIKADKERAAHEKKRAEISERIIEQTEATLPAALVYYELERMLAQFKGEVERMGLSMEDYMKQAGKNEEELRTSWRPEAEKRAKLQLILAEIAKRESITVKREELDKQVEQLLAVHKDADPQRARLYLESLLLNDAVFRFLESQGEKQEAPKRA